MQTAIVTGATGMIASALIRMLISRNVRVYALCKPGEDKSDGFFSNPLVTAIDADISALPDAADSINEKCDVLYHFAWLGTFGGGRRGQNRQEQSKGKQERGHFLHGCIILFQRSEILRKGRCIRYERSIADPFSRRKAFLFR